MTIAKAIHCIGNVLGQTFARRGNPRGAYDKKGLKKARRQLDRALVAEEEVEPTITIGKTDQVTFRLVIWTQIYENYGAHCWDGTGACPQYWKAKGGTEYHYNLGSADEVLALGFARLEALVRQLTPQINRCDDYWNEYVIGWELFSSDEKTPDEEYELGIQKLN